MKADEEKEPTDERRFVTRKVFAHLSSIDGSDTPMPTIHSDVARSKIHEEERDGHNLIDIEHPLNRNYIEQKKIWHAMQSTNSRRVADSQKRDVELEKAKAEIENLKGDADNASGDRLDKIKEKILVLLAGRDAHEHNIAQELGVGIQVAVFHLEELQSTDFIGRSISMMGEECPWYLNQEGRRYLVTHGLIT